MAEVRVQRRPAAIPQHSLSPQPQHLAPDRNRTVTCGTLGQQPNERKLIETDEQAQYLRGPG
jgi:hypothetical protein